MWLTLACPVHGDHDLWAAPGQDLASVLTDLAVDPNSAAHLRVCAASGHRWFSRGVELELNAKLGSGPSSPGCRLTPVPQAPAPLRGSWQWVLLTGHQAGQAVPIVGSARWSGAAVGPPLATRHDSDGSLSVMAPDGLAIWRTRPLTSAGRKTKARRHHRRRFWGLPTHFRSLPDQAALLFNGQAWQLRRLTGSPSPQPSSTPAPESAPQPWEPPDLNQRRAGQRDSNNPRGTWIPLAAALGMAAAMGLMTRNPVFAMLPLLGMAGYLAPRLGRVRQRHSLLDLDAASLTTALADLTAWSPNSPSHDSQVSGLRLAPWDHSAGAGSVIQIAGPDQAPAALARTWIACHLASHGPGSVKVEICGPHQDWAWTRWLNPGPDAISLLIETNPEPVSGPALGHSIVLDLVTKPGVQGSQLVEIRPNILGLTTARLNSSKSRLITPIGLAVAEQAARQGRPSARPGPADLAAALPLPAVIERWAAGGLSVPVAVNVDGQVICLDLPADGPHLLVAGATGSGKSEFLRALMLACALAASPQDLTIIGIDHKGGATFADLAGLPHLAAVVTDLDVEASSRAIISLGAELNRRERLLDQRGLANLSQLTGDDRVPRLLVVIDEFRALIETQPEAESQLERLAAQGRSLGMHLILATQRPAGAVSAQLRANLALRMCFRVAQETDSLDVIGTAEAARIDPGLPGSAYLASAGRPTQALRALLACGPAAPAARQRHWPNTWSAPPPGPVPAPRDLVQAIVAAAASAQIAAAPAPWRPALPALIPLASLPAATTNAITIGLADRPERLTQEPLSVSPQDGNLLIIGSRRSGRTNAARTVAAAALARGWTVHIITADVDALADLTSHRRFGTLAPTSQPRLVMRLLQLVPAAKPTPEPTVLIIDDAETLANLTLPGAVDHPLESINAAHSTGGLWLVATCLARHASARWTGQFPARLALPTVDRTEDLTAGVPAALAGARTQVGRVAVLRAGQEAIAQLAVATEADTWTPELANLTGPAPLRLKPVPESCPELPAARPGWVWLGYGGDFAAPLGLEIKAGARLGVIGPPSSGRSTALRLIGAQFEALQRDYLWLDGSDRDTWRQAYEVLAQDRSVIIDNADQAGPHPGEPPSSGVLIMSATTRAAAGFAGPGPLLRTRPAGLLLWSSTPGSGEAYGLRQAEVADPGAPQRPGRGVLITPQGAAPLQCALTAKSVQACDQGFRLERSY